jgi:hypothetical protein
VLPSVTGASEGTTKTARPNWLLSDQRHAAEFERGRVERFAGYRHAAPAGVSNPRRPVQSAKPARVFNNSAETRT